MIGITRSACVVAAASVVLVLAACSGAGAGSASVHPTGSPTASGRPASPTPPAATPDAAAFKTSTAAPPHVTVHSTRSQAGVNVSDIAFGDDEVGQTDAYLVIPPGGAKGPALVFFHWLGSGPTSSRDEFVDEAVSLAGRGVVSLLVQGTFPWNDKPHSAAEDIPKIEREVKMLRRGVDLLVARPDVDPARIGVVGHDFGAMYGADLLGSDPRVKVAVLMTPTARWADWCARYWYVTDGAAAYAAAIAGLDPVTWLHAAAAGRPILLQFAKTDQYVPAKVAKEITAAAGAGGDSRTYDALHPLNAPAMTDRDAWLAQQLAFGG